MSEPSTPPDDNSAEARIAALQSRSSNAQEVNHIAQTGQNISGGMSKAVIGYGAVAAYGTGGIGAVACYAAPIAAGFAGVWAGAKLADYLKLDEKILDLMGKPKLAQPGRRPAVVGHAIAHNHPFAGALGGLIAGIAVGALAAVAVAATIGTGGLLAPVLIAAAAGFGGSLAGSIANGIGSKMATVTGNIISGSPDVFFERMPVARVTDTALCKKHSPPPQIAEGSETIFINNLPLARIGHKFTCTAVIQEGCKTIFADNTTAQYGPIDAEMSKFEQLIVSGVDVFLSVGGIRFRSSKLGKKVFGEPIDPSDGGYVDFRTDFEYQSILPLSLTRVYSGKERVEGVLGTKWICNWSQRLIYDPNKRTANLEDGEGEILQFPLGAFPEFNARHLKAPHYHLTGTRECARLFDSRTQQTLIFKTREEAPATGILQAIEDRNGNRIDFIYRQGHLRRVEHSDGLTLFIGTTPEGFIETVTREGDINPLVSYSYDPLGAITDVESLFNGEFHYRYNQQGWLSHWSDSGATSVDLEYDAEGRVIATRTPEGLYNDQFVYFPDERKTKYIDATGACSTFRFNDSDLMISEEDPLGNVTLHEWDGLDRKLSTTDPLGRVTRFDYDTMGLLTGESDWAGRSTGYKYDKSGLLTEMTHPDGRKSAWAYDERGNLISATEPDGTVFRFEYDERGRLVSETAPDGAQSKWLYTIRGRLAAQIDPLGNRTGLEEDSWGRICSITDAEGHTTRYHYEQGPDNPRVDINRIVYPDGGEERFGYDREGLLSVHNGAEGQITRYRHGAFDLLREVVDARGCVTSMEYDGAARLTQITNAAGQRWKYGYDAAGRLAVETDWAGRQTLYHRDAAGRVITKRLPDGIEQHLIWNERDLLVEIATPGTRIVYIYDRADRLDQALTYTGLNTEPDTEIRLVYDQEGRLTKEIQNGVAVEYKYDDLGRCIGRTSPSGETKLSFDPLGLLAGYQSNEHNLEFKRNVLGLETQRRYGTGKAFGLEQSYDPCGRLKSQFAGPLRETQFKDHLPRHLSPAFEKQGQLSRSYSWDRSGRLVGVKDSKRGTKSFHYDPRDQVVQVKGPADLKGRREVEGYDYDALMNLVQSGEKRHEYRGDLVTRVGSASYTYDGRGRVIGKRITRNGFRPQTWHYSWDDFDRLTQAHTPDGATWHYTYDAFGRRVRKECVKPGEFGRTQRIKYLWQGATLAEEWKSYTDENDQPTQVSRWHFEPGTFNPLAKETLSLGTGAEKAGEARFYPIVTDHLGTPKELFDESGECLWQAEHSLWGAVSEIRQKTKGGNLQPITECRLRFQNQWEDEESGLYYNLHRYYDPDSGQYMSQDPIGLEGGLRTHGYVHDPMQWVDPWGLAGCSKKSSVADEAASWQGKGKYPGVDKWRNTTLKKGTIVYGGTPGQSEFYTTKTAFKRGSKKANVIGRRLQVEPHRKYGYRKEVTAYEVIEDAPAARSVAKANPQFGEGGMSQVYIPDYKTKLKPLYKVKLR